MDQKATKKSQLEYCGKQGLTEAWRFSLARAEVEEMHGSMSKQPCLPCAGDLIP